jgi:hypothetical protein
MKIVNPSIMLPPSTPSTSYYDCRYDVLRRPLGFERGAELLVDDDAAIHAWVSDSEHVLAVGRAHLIPEESDGSAPDHAGPGATKCQRSDLWRIPETAQRFKFDKWAPATKPCDKAMRVKC